jgi:hypothetical protein
MLHEEKVEGLLRAEVYRVVQESYHQVGPGRPGPDTEYGREESWEFRLRFQEDVVALAREARCDGLFPLMTNDEELSVQEALLKYK